MVKDRDDFDCPNCSSDANIQTLQVDDKTYSVKEYEQHYHMPLEECEGQQVDLIKKVCIFENPQYVCEVCMKKALSLTPEDFAKKANEVLKGTNLKAVIIETSELYGEDDDEVEEGDQYYMQPMYEGYIEDITEEEIDNSRTGRYCSLESVSEELECFAKDRKIGFIAYESQKLIGTRWKDKKELESFLRGTFYIDIEIGDADEGCQVSDYAFNGDIFEDKGYMDIYYLKIPFSSPTNNDTIYITEINVSFE